MFDAAVDTPSGISKPAFMKAFLKVTWGHCNGIPCTNSGSLPLGSPGIPVCTLPYGSTSRLSFATDMLARRSLANRCPQSTPLPSYTLTLAVALQSSMANLRKQKESAGSSAGTGVEGGVAAPSTPEAILDDLEARKEWVLDSIAQARGRGEPRAEHVALHYATLVDTCSKVRWEVHDAFPAKYAARDCVFEPGGGGVPVMCSSERVCLPALRCEPPVAVSPAAARTCLCCGSLLSRAATASLRVTPVRIAPVRQT